MQLQLKHLPILFLAVATICLAGAVSAGGTGAAEPQGDSSLAAAQR